MRVTPQYTKIRYKYMDLTLTNLPTKMVVIINMIIGILRTLIEWLSTLKEYASNYGEVLKVAGLRT